MKNAPYNTAMFGLLITVLRIGMFVAIIDSGFGQVLGVIFAAAFAIFIAVGVYVSSYFARHKETKIAAIVGMVVFGFADLWFNEATVIYYTSSADLVGPERTFLGLSSEVIRYSMQGTALGFGALPTIGAAIFAWIQSGTGRVAELNRPGAFSRMFTAFSKMVSGYFVGIAIWSERKAKYAPQDGGNMPIVDGQLLANNGKVAPRRWHSLTAEETAIIPQKSRAELRQLFGISDGIAGEWKRRINAGERPWQKVSK